MNTGKYPIVYGALAMPTSLFIYNNKWYQNTKEAYDILVNNDTANFDEIDPKLEGCSPETSSVLQKRFQKKQGLFCIVFFTCLGIECC